MNRRRALPLIVAGASAAVGLAACQPARLVRRDPSRRLVLRVNLHGSAPYAPLLLMRERRLLESAVPGLSVEWKTIAGIDAVNEALREGGLDLAVGSIPSFLLAREAGLPARIVSGISALPCAILGRAGLRSLAAIRADDPIAVPELDSLESTVLQLAALRELGDSEALASNLVTRAHVDVLPSLKLGKELAAHVTVTPFLELELEGNGPERLVDSRDLFGGLPTTALAYALPTLQERSGPLLAAFHETLADAARLAAVDPVASAHLLSESEELRIVPERLGSLLAGSGWQPGPRLVGISTVAELWRRTGRLKQPLSPWSELAFDGVREG